MVITIAGGGSTFTAGIVKSIALRREELEVDEIRLFDINKERQDKVAVVVDWVLHKELNTDIKLVVTTDVQQAYTDASFVFAQMRVGGYAMREQDEKIPLRHGLWNAYHLPHDQADRRRGKVCQEGLLDPELLQPRRHRIRSLPQAAPEGTDHQHLRYAHRHH